MPAFSSFAIGAMAAASIATGAAGAAMAGEETSRRSLPPELEADMIRRNTQEMKDIELEIAQSKALERAYNTRLDTATQILQGGETPELLKALGKSTLEIANAFGGDIQKAMKGGWLDEETAKELESLKTMEIEDPALKMQISEDRKRLRSQLVSQGLSPDQVDRAMQQYDERAQSRTFERSQELVTRRLGILTTGEEFKQAGFERGMAEFGAMRSTAYGGALALTELAGNRLQAGQAGIESRSALRDTAFSRSMDLGTFDFTKTGSQAMESGLIGPGSYKQQTGIWRGDVKPYTQLYNRTSAEESPWLQRRQAHGTTQKRAGDEEAKRQLRAQGYDV